VENTVPEEKFSISEEHYRVIYENSPLGIGLFDAEGGLKDANRAVWIYSA
jgi:PAS domain S-box-containing protein